jgi:CRP-like cAMP-binding protein
VITVEALTAVPAFARLDGRARAAVAAVMHERTYPDGATILEQGTRSGGVFALLEGQVRVERRLPDGGTVDLVTVGPGALFGTLASMDGGERAATCVARGSVSCAVLPRMEFQALLEGRTPAALSFQVGVLRDLFKDLRASNRRLAELVALDDQELSLVQVGDVFGSLG